MPRRHNRMPWRVLAHGRGRARDRIAFDDIGASHGHEFDEVVLGDWLHIEQMDVNWYWMRLGQKTFAVTIDPKTGNMKSIKAQE